MKKIGRPIEKNSRRQRAIALGINPSTLRYREFPEESKARIKKSYLKYREKRLKSMRDYYYNNKLLW